MFIDHVVIEAYAGSGGDGCVAFRREKYVPRGGPSGGNGGRGGDVVVAATTELSTLIDLRYQRVYRAERGSHGMGKSQKGRDGASCEIRVPVGTQIRDLDSGEILGDLVESGQRVVAARGGKGGLGNEHFKSSRNRAPRRVTSGGTGEARRLEITLKLVADVGLVGEPNAGKSTLLSRVSAARPKVAEYPFTTRTPVLGIVRLDVAESFVVVDIPGLIEGAHAGKGMGREFLRHVERCRALVYLVDVTLDDPADHYRMLRGELLRYDPSLLERPSVVVLSKCDLVEGGVSAVDCGAAGIRERVVPISAVSGEGIDRLMGEIVRIMPGRAER